MQPVAQIVLGLVPQPDGTTAVQLATPPGMSRDAVLAVLAQTLAAVAQAPPPPPAPVVAVPDAAQARRLLAT